MDARPSTSMDDNQASTSHSFDVNWMRKVVEDSGNGSNTVIDKEAMEEMVHLTTMRLFSILQSAKRYSTHSLRSTVTGEDIELAKAELAEQEPFGSSQKWMTPLSSGTSFGGYDTPQNDEIIDLFSMASLPAVKLPHKMMLKAHWLVIEGSQPYIHENPIPDGFNPEKKVGKKDISLPAPLPLDESIPSYIHHLSNGSTIWNTGSFIYGPSVPSGLTVPPSALSHGVTGCSTLPWLPSLPPPPIPGVQLNLSPEKDKKGQDGGTGQNAVKTLHISHTPMAQKVFFEMITGNAIGNDEEKRTESLHILATNTGLQPLIPRFAIFIAEGVRFHVSASNLRALSRLMRMSHALVINRSNDLSKGLVDLLPSVLSCVLSSRLCSDPLSEDHWALRRFAATIATHLTRQYDQCDVRARVTKVLSGVWREGNERPLTTVYGAVYTLGQMGLQTMSTLCLPSLGTVYERIENCMMMSPGGEERIAAEKLGKLIVKLFAEYVLECVPGDIVNPQDYTKIFGGFGEKIRQLVKDGQLGIRVGPPKPSFGLPSSLRRIYSPSLRATPSPLPYNSNQNRPRSQLSSSHHSSGNSGQSSHRRMEQNGRPVVAQQFPLTVRPSHNTTFQGFR